MTTIELQQWRESFVERYLNKIDDMEISEELAFVAEHGQAVSRLLAYTVCRGYVSRHAGIGLTAWVLRNFVEWRYLTAMFRTFERMMGTKDFMRIISSAARANPMKPRLSRARKGS